MRPAAPVLLHSLSTMGKMTLAAMFDGYGAPEVLRVARVDRPEPGPTDVLVRVEASFCQRRRSHRAPGEAAAAHRQEVPAARRHRLGRRDHRGRSGRHRSRDRRPRLGCRGRTRQSWRRRRVRARTRSERLDRAAIAHLRRGCVAPLRRQHVSRGPAGDCSTAARGAPARARSRRRRGRGGRADRQNARRARHCARKSGHLRLRTRTGRGRGHRLPHARGRTGQVRRHLRHSGHRPPSVPATAGAWWTHGHDRLRHRPDRAQPRLHPPSRASTARVASDCSSAIPDGSCSPSSPTPPSEGICVRSSTRCTL